MATALPFPAQSASEPNRALITFSVILATVLQVLDTTIANVALPHMQASLGATRESVTWVLTSYIVASAVATPITGWLADRFGQKPLFIISIAGFIVFSMLCGASTSLEAMILFRAGQGIMGAFLVPLSQTVMLDIYPREKHAQAMALWGMAVMVSPIAGPVLGGWLTDNYDWRWVFYVNLPIGLIALAGVIVSLPAKAKLIRKFDLFGFSMLSICLVSLQLMLDRGPHLDWFDSPEVVIEGAVAMAALWVFGIHLATGKTRLFDPVLLRDRTFVSALGFTFLVGAVMMAGAALLPPMLEQLFGYPVMTAGILMAPRGAGLLIATVIFSRLASRIDIRVMIGIGMVLIAWSLEMMTGFTLGMGQQPVAVSGFVQGLGMGFVVMPLNILAFASVPAQQRTDASGLYNLMRGIGGSIGVSVVTAVLAHNVQVSHSELAANITSQTIPVTPGLVSGLGQYGAMAAAMIDGEINRQALMIAYIDDYHLMMIATLVSIPLLLLLRKPKPPAPGEQEIHVAVE